MNPADSDIKSFKDAAIQTHSDRAGQFAESYTELEENPFSDCFVYSRHRLRSYLDQYIPRDGRGLKLLDVGCGTGNHMAELRGWGYEVAGVDISDEMLRYARMNNPDSPVIAADVDEIPLPDASFDLILSIEVLRHLPRSERTIREMGRLLKPGGLCLVTATPLLNLNGYTIINKVAHAMKVGNLARHKQSFHSSGRLKREFSQAGFKSVEIHGVYMGPVNWAARLVPKALPKILRSWEPVDTALSDKWALRELSNMFLIRAVR